MNHIKWKELIISLLISLGTGAIAWLLTLDSMQKYENLYKPPLSPPGWAFPVVWTILFILMGIASYLIYVSGTRDELFAQGKPVSAKEKQQALRTYAVQLLVNIIWSVIFFRLEAYLLAFAWLILLWYLVFKTIKEFYNINQIAGILLLPYLLWVTFAGYLNLAIAIHYLM